jgi:transcriptional regulator with XRE-family HTH domain
MKDEFANNLRAMMKRQNKTAKDLGNDTRLNYRTIEGWLDARKAIPRADDAVTVAHALSTTVEYLVTGQELSGLSPRLAAIARNLAHLPEVDIEEIETLIDLKISRQDKQEAPDELQQNA